MEFRRTKESSYWSLPVQECISCLCCIMMIAGMLFARALLSVSMILFFLNALHPQKIRQNWYDFKSNRFATFAMVFFGVYLISGLWSEDVANWFSVLQIKLPFVFVPFAMLDMPLYKRKWIKFVIAGMLIVLLGGMIYSFSFLVGDFSNYKSGSHFPSPLEGDYIRYTITLVLALQFVIYFFYHRRKYSLSKLHLGMLLIWSILAIAYIHIQAAKSGLVSFYLLVGIFLLYHLIRKKRVLIMIGMAAVVIIAAIGLRNLPSVKKQIKDFSYERQVWQTNDTAGYNNSYSFVPRIISYQIALGIIKSRPIMGVGAGDVKNEMDKVYAERYPNIHKLFRILPHNQFICTALAVGIPLSCSLIVMLLSPVYTKANRKNIYIIACIVIMFFGLMIEPMLEVQYGIFVYLFFTLLWMRIATGQGKEVPEVNGKNILLS